MRLLTKSLGFLVYNLSNDDYLAAEINEKFRNLRSWSSHPSSSKLFKSRQLAINSIRRIIGDTSRVLILAELSETSKNYAVTYLSQFSFSENKFIEKPLDPSKSSESNS